MPSVTVTNIKQQQKRADRYSIFLDDKYAFSVSQDGLLAMGLRIGRSYEPDALQELRQSAVLDKLYDQALRYLALRLRSRWEVAQYLKRKEAVSSDADYVLARLEEHRWLNDAAFAKSWVENRRLLRSTSQRRLRQELQAKRVSPEIIQAVLAEDETDERAVLRDMIERKRRITRYQDNEKLMAYLMRQGFSYDDVKQALAGAD